MEHRKLGTTDLVISVVGFGGWALGGAGWAYDGGPGRDRTSLEALLHACAAGVTWVDTAPTYGRGHSEEVIGQAMRRLGSGRPLVFTKCGRRWDSPSSKPRSDLRPSAIRADCEASLRRLRVEVIDLLQIHWPEDPPLTPIEESWAAMRALVDEGKIRAAGVCNFDAGLLDRCEAVGHVDSLQIPFSLIARDAAAGLLQWAAEHQTGVLAYSPMQVGLLTDSFEAARISTLHPEDWRRRHPDYQDPRLERNLALRDGLRWIARDHGATVAAVAVAWVLGWPQVSGAIAGASKASQVDEWVGASSLALADGDLAAIADVIRRSGAGSGPLAPPHPSTTST